MDISIVLPAYNEEKNVKPLAKEINQAMGTTGLDCEVIWINDGSTDDTLFVLQNIVKKYSNHKIVDFRRNSGQTASLMAGFDYSKGDLIVTMDSDMQNDPRDIPAMIEKLKKDDLDMVVGWRKNRKDKALVRKFPSRIANLIIKRMFGTKIHDRGCALKVMTKELANELKLYGELHRFIAEIAGEYGARIAEMEVNHRPRKKGKSKYGLMRTFKVILDIANLKFLLMHKTTPIQILGPVALVSYVLSFVAGLALIGMKIFQDFDMTGNPMLIVSVMFFVTGSQFIVLGLMGELLIRSYYELNGKKIYSVRRVYEKE
ncbi:glycosyltransferase family 2 protein [Candidatus Dojkabacteria bacterium]|nr:glycosyltransferase family 2 protein [Candidatus Dojkabacteria bacterium]